MENGTPGAPLERTFGQLDGVALVLSGVIGAGILSTPGLIAGYLGSPWRIMGIWAFGGMSVALAALVFAELAAMMPETGGKYVYVRRAYGETAGCFTGWADVLLARSFTAALKAVLIGQYVVALAGRGSAKATTAIVIVAFVLVNLRGVRLGKLFQNLSTGVKLALLMAVVVAGFAVHRAGTWATVSTIPGRGLAGFALASQAVFLSYYGAETTLGMAGEVRAPGRNLPRMLLLGLAGVVLVFLLLNAAMLSALTPARMAASTNVTRDVLARSLGARAGVAVTLVAVGVLINSLNFSFLGAPRVAFGLARDGLAPRSLSRVNARGTPAIALCVFGALSLLIALSGTIELIIRLMSFMALAVDAMILTTLFVLRRQAPRAVRPFRVPLYPLVPAAALISYATMLVMITLTQPRLAAGGSALVAVAAAGAWLAMRLRRSAPAIELLHPAD